MGPCAYLHEQTEPIFLAFTSPLHWCRPTPARGPGPASGTRGLKPPFFSLPLSAQMALAPFCSHEYISQFKNVQGSSFIPSRSLSLARQGSTHAAISAKPRVGRGLTVTSVPLGGSCREAERSPGSGCDHLYLTDEGAEAFRGVISLTQSHTTGGRRRPT